MSQKSKVHYRLEIKNPETHIVNIKISTLRDIRENSLQLFLPSWSPGSYMMREYSRNIRWVKATSANGERIYVEQVDKGTWDLDWKKSELKKSDELKFEVEYELFCHDLTVRTSHVDISHAFIHGPSIFMGILGREVEMPELEVIINPLWSKISTGLKDISPRRDIFLYTAKNYDEFIDSPLEMGCHETDGFLIDDTPHELAVFGSTISLQKSFKQDIEKIVDHIQKTMGGIPYENYSFIIHFAPNIYGGLEHLNSTVLHYCSYEMGSIKGYQKWLELVAHEYFHLWNVKRIRPKELGPFNYRQECFTRMHWLTEGLTSFMDQFFIFRTNFLSLAEYLECLKESMNRYLEIPGRKFHSLEDSSFNAWIKLYRPDENYNNSSISYYLKGGLVFFLLHLEFLKRKKCMTSLLDMLWQRYLKNSREGVQADEVYDMIGMIGGEKIKEKFIEMIETTKEIDFEAYLKDVGLVIEYELPEINFDFQANFKGERVFVTKVILDGASYKSGLNAGDEILAMNGLRFTKDEYLKRKQFLNKASSYKLLIARCSYIMELDLNVKTITKRIKKISSSGKDEKIKEYLMGIMPE